jgi:DNA-binding CsgD family transcriptional regulator
MQDNVLMLSNNSIDHIALIDALGIDNFFSVLVKLFESQLSIDSSSVICYNKNKPPELLFSDLLEHEENIFFASFLDGAYVASPAYQGVMNNYSDGMYAWSDLMPKGFMSSQMYASYYQPSSIEDLVYFFINNGDLGFIQFCLGRHSPNPKFKDSELALLETMGGFVSSLIRKHMDFILKQEKEEKKEKASLPLSSLVSERVNYLLDNFESEVLTSRERQIAKLVITGHSSQSAADSLNISPGTERVHRAKLYAKLKLRSNSELFSCFLDQLTRLY